MKPSHRYLSGFTMVELMIAMVLGLFIIGIAGTAMHGQLKTSSFGSSLTRTQTQARFALQELATAIRSSGYLGCSNASQAQPLVPAGYNSVATYSTNYSPLKGFEVRSGGWKPSMPEGYTAYSMPTSGFGTPVIGSHALFVEGSIGQGAALLNSTILGQYIDVIDRSSGLEKGDMALIGDCDSAEAFFIKDTTQLGQGTWRIHPQQNLVDIYEVSSKYPKSVRVHPYRRTLYFIGDSGRKTPHGDQIRSLFQHRHPFESTVPEEMIEGVEAMVLAFRQVKDDGAIVELLAGHPDLDPIDTISVRASLLVSVPTYREDGNVAPPHILSGVLVGTDPNAGPSRLDDKRIRKVYEQVVNLRNRVGSLL